MLPVVGLLSTFREGLLARDAVRSLLGCCDRVLCLEAPIGAADPDAGEPSRLWDGKKRPPSLLVSERGPFATDAAKRTALLRWAHRFQQQIGQPEWWAVVLDGDEVLLWPELLPAYLERARAEDAAGSLKLKLVTAADGRSEVQETGARILPGHLVDEYVLSSYQIRLRGTATVLTLPNGPAQRPPLQGEPHILHRSYLRPPSRTDRQSEAERIALVELGFSHLEPAAAVTGRR